MYGGHHPSGSDRLPGDPVTTVTAHVIQEA
jgi:hypothetical protein